MVSEVATGFKPIVQAKDEVPEVWFFGGSTLIRASSQSTGGALFMVEQQGEPGVASPYHVHHNEDEYFYILEGQVRFVSGDQQWIAEAGGFVFLPRDIPHGFEVVGDSTARFLLLTTPARFGDFVQEFSTAAPAAPDLGAVMAAAPGYGLEILGPLPEA
ncbi:hypothetical protein BH23CHL4_BH23CHL4_30590 [soil metagenome]